MNFICNEEYVKHVECCEVQCNVMTIMNVEYVCHWKDECRTLAYMCQSSRNIIMDDGIEMMEWIWKVVDDKYKYVMVAIDKRRRACGARKEYIYNDIYI